MNSQRTPPSTSKPGCGQVLLVGAGPGDPDLITLAGADALRRADVVIYDRLAPAELLQLAPARAQRIDAGKRPGRAGAAQAEICRLMIEHARRGACVVRLKGGDPGLFARAAEELEALAEAGIPAKIIPGVPSACGAAAYAGFPLTARGAAPGVAFLTGHSAANSAAPVDWTAAARFPGTLVVHMGIQRLEAIVAALLDGGRPADTPAAVIENATTPAQRIVAASLDRILLETRRAGIRPPALLVVGGSLKARPRVAPPPPGPLAGERVLVTRPAGRAGPMVRALRRAGARVFAVPAIRIHPTPIPPAAAEILDAIADFDDVILTSAAGVDALFQRLYERGRDARALAGCRIAAIGPATAARLAPYGIHADLVAHPALAEALFEALERAGPLAGRRALLARAAGVRPFLAAALRRAGALVAELPLYRTEPDPALARKLPGLLREAPAWVTFTSPSCAGAVAAVIEDAGDLGLRRFIRPVSIGPVTSRRLRELGLDPAVEARDHTADGLVAALIAAVANENPGGGTGPFASHPSRLSQKEQKS